jgi:hypothetical protein
MKHNNSPNVAVVEISAKNAKVAEESCCHKSACGMSTSCLSDIGRLGASASPS